MIGKKNVYLYLGLVLGSLLGLIRIAAGGHFFSDIIFSQIIVTVTILTSFILYKKFNKSSKSKNTPEVL